MALPEMKPNQRGAQWAELLGFLVLLAFLVGGIGVFGWQLVGWLRSGAWESVSVLEFFGWGSPGSEWVHNPTDWVGLWRLLSALPLSLTLIAIGGVGLVADARDRRRDALD
jgi:hypothetical protein